MTNMLILLLLSLLAMAVQVHCQCSIGRNAVELSNGVFTYTDAHGNLQLLKTASVGIGVTLTMHCRQGEVIQTTCGRNRRFNPPLPLTCNNALTAPSVRAVPNNDPTCPATMYVVGYTFNNRHLELYRVCYSSQNMRAFFSEAMLYPKSFFPNRPFIQFTTDEIITPRQEASFSKRNILSAFTRIYGANQRYIPNMRELIINRGHLTASADFLFSDQSSGTFKYVNVVPQFSSINDGNWKDIEEWVRNQIPDNSFLRVRTGAKEVLSLLHSSGASREPAYLYQTNQNPVPKWMYKIVWNENNQPIYAFITYNNIYDPQPQAPSAYCPNPIRCPMALTQTAALGYTFCCNPTTFTV